LRSGRPHLGYRQGLQRQRRPRKQGSVRRGESVFSWDGIGDDGKKKPDGSYSITIGAATRRVNWSTTEMTGEVTGVDLTDTAAGAARRQRPRQHVERALGTGGNGRWRA
jgi:hypothetical protein